MVLLIVNVGSRAVYHNQVHVNARTVKNDVQLQKKDRTKLYCDWII